MKKENPEEASLEYWLKSFAPAPLPPPEGEAYWIGLKASIMEKVRMAQPLTQPPKPSGPERVSNPVPPPKPHRPPAT